MSAKRATLVIHLCSRIALSEVINLLLQGYGYFVGHHCGTDGKACVPRTVDPDQVTTQTARDAGSKANRCGRGLGVGIGHDL